MARAQYPFLVGEQLPEIGDRPGDIPGFPPQRGEFLAGFQGVRVVRAEDAELVIKQLAESGCGPGRISGPGLPVSEVVPHPQGAGMIRAEYRHLVVEELATLIAQAAADVAER